MIKEKTGWDNYYHEKEKVNEKLLFSMDEMDNYSKSNARTKVIFATIFGFLLGAIFIILMVLAFPDMFKP